MPLTDFAIRTAKPDEKSKKMFDSNGLYLEIAPAGGKWWRMKYRYGGKEKRISLGVYPEITLKEARERRDNAKKLLAQGVDPSGHRKAAKAAAAEELSSSFEVIAREWYEKYKNSWAESHYKKISARLENDIFPLIGTKPVKSITAPDLLNALRRIEARGAKDTAHRALQNCGQIFRYAIATGRAERDPAADLRGALAPVKSNNFVSIKEPKAVGALLRDIDAYNGNAIVRAALRLAPYIFVRPGELRRAEWQEIDFGTAEWRIPAAKMKMRQIHIVPLARQVLEILSDLRQYTAQSRYLFPSMRANSAPISDATLLAALRRLGYGKEDMTVHGFRSMASTLLNEQGYNMDWIERQLAHGERNSIRAAYNYAQHLSERRRMMQEWADFLDKLRGNYV